MSSGGTLLNDFMRLILGRWRCVVICWVVLLLFSGCAMKSDAVKVVKECVLPTEQSSSLIGRWPQLAIPIALQANAFNDYEKSLIVKSVSTWNKFYSASLGYQLFDIGDESNPRTSAIAHPSSICAQSGIVNVTSKLGDTSTFGKPVVIYKMGTWSNSNAKIIALTTSCPSSASPLKKFFNAMMELNYQNFFISGKLQPDLQTIVTHELGHLAGLDHSCTTSTAKATFIGCNNGSLSADYYTSVMFPSFAFDSTGSGEVRSTLNNNDQGRANCLYNYK